MVDRMHGWLYGERAFYSTERRSGSLRCGITNETVLPDRPLRALLRHACRRAECTYAVTINVKQWNGSSLMHGLAAASTFALWLSDPIEVMSRGCGPVVYAETLYSIAVHEAKHVADHQRGRLFGDYLRHHRNRPHERRADVTASLALRAARLGIDKVAARWIEELRQWIQTEYSLREKKGGNA